MGKSKKVVIVGGVAGGATAAARLRRLDETVEILMFERGEYISFANCGLPYYIGGSIDSRDKLLLQTVEGMSNRFNMDIRNFSEVTKINRGRKTISVRRTQTGEVYEEAYDVLILSPGAKPVKLEIPGIENAGNLFTLRNIPDIDKIKSYVESHKVQKAVVIGGGFIGVEMAENLWDLGIHVSLVEAGNQIMAPVDYEMAVMLHSHLKQKGVRLILEDGVKAIVNNGKKVLLNSGAVLDADMIIFSIGVAPESILAKEAGLALGVKNTIKVGPTLQTEDPSIYAIGDAIEVVDFVNGNPTMIPLAWPANRQGRLAADHIAGMDVRYNGTMGTSIAKVFDLTVAATGNNEKTLKRLELPYEAIHIHPNSHAGYYPGAAPIAFKLLFHPTNGTIYGAQAIGTDGADKRIDVIATAIKGKLTVHDLPDLELSYAPPYSSAKDPVNMAGYVASNIMDGMVETVQWHEIDALVQNGGLLIDVREPVEREIGYIPGSINIPLHDVRKHLNELPKDKTIFVSCQVGLRGYLAARILKQHGFHVKNLDGGYKTYKAVYENNQPEHSLSEDKKTYAVKDEENMHAVRTVTVDACGLQCPGPILRVKEQMEELNDGDILEVSASDPGFASDLEAWSKRTGHTLVSSSFENKVVKAVVKKGNANNHVVRSAASETKSGATMVVFSGDLDKAMASFIIANGAAAMGKNVTMFFTFWGLNILRREDAPRVEKESMERVFGMMLPKGPSELPLSKMNMGGMGTKMMKSVMEKKNVDTLQTLIQTAQNAGVKLVACTMSMDVMGIKKEELIDGIDFAGVATYLSDTEDAGLNLFI
ncbi:DsrE/DsrF/DrsH-like family protein [Bacillus sp. 03113]|uniref:DsrE/DsrF/DrsH-like family protein n=1 Tax=Bacillus sp. 03113 TaxID=2578211 RepID=UPI001142DD5B|nr:DsrE/DsrF/DrsH-like family protein [Bacillus sp. 03113]